LVVMAGQEFDEFFRACFDPVARALMLAGAERELAHDATQEALVRALRRWRQVRQLGRPDGWVYVVAMNYVRDRWRRQARSHRNGPDRADGRASVDPSGAIATRLCVRDAIATLPPRQRQAVVLRYVADLPLFDVAAAMGCSVGTVKSTLHAALRALRVEIDDEEDADADG
jgi:RNA polymerase sigma-70 factor, ECF subfamily